jgi:hypothetical protein
VKFADGTVRRFDGGSGALLGSARFAVADDNNRAVDPRFDEKSRTNQA